MRRTVAALAAALLLAGCRGDPEPKIEAVPTESPTVSVSESPSSSPAQPRVESAGAYLRRWAMLDAEMQNSGDTSAYREATPDCATCTVFADRVDRIYANGGSISFDGQTVTQIQKFAANNEVAKFDVSIDAGPTEFRENAQAAVATLPGGPTLFRVTIRKAGSTWTLLEADRLPA